MISVCLLSLIIFVTCSLLLASKEQSSHRNLLGLGPPKLTVEDIIHAATKGPTVQKMTFETDSTPHVPSSQAIFSCAFSTTYMAKDAIFFAGTARKAGYTGDIVVAVLAGSNKDFLEKLKSYKVSIYTVSMDCAGLNDMRCKFAGEADVPVTLTRYYFYQKWALLYPKNAYLMIADFRDVLFQSNPFKNKFNDWGPNNYDLVLFQESHPNRVISRCPHMGGYVMGCYGRAVYRKIGASTISSSGVIFGTRDAIIIYVSNLRVILF
jgi:hypothetical protein